MPHVKLSESDRLNHALMAAIRYGMSMYDVNPESLALSIRADRSTLYRRFKHPEDFTIGELRTISTKLHIPLEKLIKGEVA